MGTCDKFLEIHIHEAVPFLSLTGLAYSSRIPSSFVNIPKLSRSLYIILFTQSLVEITSILLYHC